MPLVEDGYWATKDKRHQVQTGHQPNLGSVFDSLMLLVGQFAANHASFKCKVGDYVGGFLKKQGFWFENLTILGQEVSSGEKGILVQSNTFSYGYDTLDKYFKVKDVSLLTMTDKAETICRMAPCLDTDYGRLDRTDYGGCAWFLSEGMDLEKGYPATRNGSFDVGDLRFRDLCCLFGGGTTSPNITGFGSYPINLAREDIFPAAEYFACTKRDDAESCMRQFGSMPRQFYQAEIEPLMDLCLVADADMCGNILARKAWPAMFTEGLNLEKRFWQMLENVTIPLLFKAAGSSEVRQLRRVWYEYDIGRNIKNHLNNTIKIEDRNSIIK